MITAIMIQISLDMVNLQPIRWKYVTHGFRIEVNSGLKAINILAAISSLNPPCSLPPRQFKWLCYNRVQVFWLILGHFMEGKAENLMGNGVAALIDHAYLKVNSQSAISGLKFAVEETAKFGFRSLCVHPVLAGTVKKNFPRTKVSAVVSYPFGADSLAVKTFAIQELAEQGVDEVDVVLDLFAIVNGNLNKVGLEAESLGELCHKCGIYLKAIIETPILSDDKIRATAEVLRSSPVACIKTSTGYNREPTSLDHVKLISNVVGGVKKIKAAGGISNLYQVRAMLDAGADIIGTSSGVRIIEEARDEVSKTTIS